MWQFLTRGNLKENAALVEDIQKFAANKGITLAQLSLGWVIHQGYDVFPIPGTTKLKHLEENVQGSDVTLTVEEAEKIATAATKIKGERGNEAEDAEDDEDQRWKMRMLSKTTTHFK